MSLRPALCMLTRKFLQVPVSAKNPKSILKTKHGPNKVRNLPTLLPGEDTFVAQSQRIALSSTVMDSVSGRQQINPSEGASGGKKRGRKPKVSSVSGLDISGVGPLTPEVKSAKKDDKKRGRRSNVSRDEFLNFVFQKEATPEEPSVLGVAAAGSEVDNDSDSSDDGWEELKNGDDGSIKKFLPKTNYMRKSVVISGNIKSKTKNQLSKPKGNPKKKVMKKLQKELESESVINEKEESTSMKSPKNFTMIDESNITTSKRKSQHRSLDSPSPVKPSGASKSSLNSGEETCSLSINSQNFERTRLPLSFQNFSTDSAKAMIAAMEKEVEAQEAAKKVEEGKSNEESFTSPKRGRGRPKKSSLFAPNFDIFETPVPVGRKRKNEEDLSKDNKKSKSGYPTTNSPMVIANSVSKVRKTFPQLNGGEKTSLTPTSMVMDSPSPVRRSGRDSTRISTIATTNALKSPVMARPIDPVFHEVAAQSPGYTATQNAPILEGAVIFVDFRAENENRGNVIKAKAKELGATIADKLSADATHVIFKDGGRLNYQKAKKLGIPILSAGWLEESKKEGRKMPESHFPSVSIEKYDSPGLFPKMKKMKSMQPKTLDEDFDRASKAQDRKQKMLEKKLLKEQEAQKLKNPVTNIQYPPHEHYYRGSPHNSSRIRQTNSNKESPLHDILQEIGPNARYSKTSGKTSLPNLSPTESEFDTPLAKRLVGRYQSPLLSRNVAEASSSKTSSSTAEVKDSNSLPRTPRKSRTGDNSVLMTSNLDTTVRPRKGNSRTNDSKEATPNVKFVPLSAKHDDTIQVNETAEESPVMRRSRRSTTAISTLATTQAVAQESNKKDTFSVQETQRDEKVEGSPNYKELLPSPVLGGRRRGRPKKTVAEPSDTIFSDPQLESTRLMPKPAALSKTGVGDPQLESTRLVPKASAQKSSLKQISPVAKVGKPRAPTAAENDLLFDALIQGKPITPSPSPPKTAEKPKKLVLSSATPKKVASPVKTPKDISESPQSSFNKTPRVIAPWRHLAELDKPEKSTDVAESDDVYEFSGFPDDPPSKKKEIAPLTTRRKSKEVQKTRDTSFGRPSRVKMFMVAPHGAYSGYATGIKRKLEQNANKSQSQSPLRSPLRSPMRSPIRAGLGSPRGETSQTRSPRFSVGSPRASSSQMTGSPRASTSQRIGSPRVDQSQRNGSPRIDPSQRLGSPRIDPSQRIGSPRVERVHPYSSPSNRIGGSPKSGYSSPRAKHGVLLVDVPADKPGISLTGFSPDYNIVEAVGKHHTVSAAVGQPPNRAGKDRTHEKPLENGKVSSHDAGIAASKATVVSNSDGTVSVVTKELTIPINAENQVLQADSSKKSVLLSRIFSKPPSKDSKDEDDQKVTSEELKTVEEKKFEEKNNSKNLKNKRKLFPSKNNLVLDQTADPNMIASTDNIENVHCDEVVKKKRNRTVIRKKSGELVAEPPDRKAAQEGFRKPSRKASKKIASMKDASSDSDSVHSNASEDFSVASQSLPEPEQSNKKLGRKKVKKMAPPRRSSFDFEPLPKFLKKKEEKTDVQDESCSVKSRRGKGTRGNTPTPVSNIVCTSCHKDDINLVKQLVKMFGTFSFSTTVTSNTSHVVSGEGKRTLNLLKGLLQGCWIVTKVSLRTILNTFNFTTLELIKEWVLSSLEESKWVDEEPYEMVDFSPAVRNLRQEKGAFQGSFKSELFKGTSLKISLSLIILF